MRDIMATVDLQEQSIGGEGEDAEGLMRCVGCVYVRCECVVMCGTEWEMYLQLTVAPSHETASLVSHSETRRCWRALMHHSCQLPKGGNRDLGGRGK